jgi:NADP-dependent 3-hydroxy acid dehydrogenase YdfG
MQVDVSDRASVERMIAETGEVDLLVANAGVSEGHAQRPSWEIDPDKWWQIYEVNVLGVHLCCRAVIPGMLERGRGRIVITGSGAAAARAPRMRRARLPRVAMARCWRTSSPGAFPSSSSAPAWCGRS